MYVISTVIVNVVVNIRYYDQDHFNTKSNPV